MEVTSTGQVITVAPAQTALQALPAAGFDILLSCEQGVCGTCLTGIKAGTPEHRDHYLTPDEQDTNNQFLPCCPRTKGRLLVSDLYEGSGMRCCKSMRVQEVTNKGPLFFGGKAHAITGTSLDNILMCTITGSSKPNAGATFTTIRD